MVELDTMLSLLQTVSIIIGVFYYIMTLQNSNKNQQLTLKAQEQAVETRQAQLFMNIYGQMANKEAQLYYLDLQKIEMNGHKDWNKLKEDREMFSVLGWYFSFYAGMGVLIEEGLIDIRLVAKMMSGNIAWFWRKYRDGIYDVRAHNRWPRFNIMIEYLYNQIIEYAEKHPELEIETPERL